MTTKENKNASVATDSTPTSGSEFIPHEDEDVIYCWWCSNEHYPKWTPSCWKADSIEKALEKLDKYCAGMKKNYNLKLIKEVRTARFYEVDVPNKRI